MFLINDTPKNEQNKFYFEIVKNVSVCWLFHTFYAVLHSRIYCSFLAGLICNYLNFHLTIRWFTQSWNPQIDVEQNGLIYGCLVETVDIKQRSGKLDKMPLFYVIRWIFSVDDLFTDTTSRLWDLLPHLTTTQLVQVQSTSMQFNRTQSNPRFMLQKLQEKVLQYFQDSN